ncbi:MAG: hypothetical protein INQ03_21865 [Candidatus Heimdallarchaeota archaeon]|nr:hypothetical protein [Candidatus Heimdallarchaeota archaeon]
MIKKTRTLLGRASAIFNYLDRFWVVDDPLPKSNFQEIGLSPREADRWLELIRYIQSQPLVGLTMKGKRTYVHLRENKFMQLMKKQFTDPDLEYNQRESALLLYFKSLLIHERLHGEPVTIEDLIEQTWVIDRPTIKRIAEDANSQLEDSD